MLIKRLLPLVAAFLAVAEAGMSKKEMREYTQKRRSPGPKILQSKRQLPKEPTGVKSIISPSGVNITYKMPGQEGICETTPGVNSYAGFINLAADVHVFFYFFESRRDPANDPMTLWLNGGPGSDSLIGLFEELGPCNVSANLKTHINPHSFNNISNMLFLSQPVGVGFSYATKEAGYLNDVTGVVQTSPVNGEGPNIGRFPVINASAVDTTELAAMAAWELLQGFYSALPQLDSKVNSTEFNLFTESYGGHYGPAFFEYFYQQNAAIANGTAKGKAMTFNALGVINGIIDETIQVPYYPKFAMNNTYGIKLYNETIYNYAETALNMPNGCLSQLSYCAAANRSTPAGLAVCAEASDECRDNVEGVYYNFGDRGVYDIRHPYLDPTPPSNFEYFLNLASTQQALGVDTNYTMYSNDDVYYAFQQTGDFGMPNFIEDLEMLLNSSVRVSLIYGDADYICNWFGGEAISLAANYAHSAQFRKAGYVPMTVNGVEYGETREYGNFSFTRVYESGHEVPYYQPIAALQLFNRTINHFDIPSGKVKINGTYGTTGKAHATHTEPFVALPTSTSSAKAKRWSA